MGGQNDENVCPECNGDDAGLNGWRLAGEGVYVGLTAPP
jgi:hypothetical protein